MMYRGLVLGVGVIAAWTNPAGAEESALVWPRTPAISVGDAERVVAEQGLEVVSWSPIAERLREHAERARDREASVLEAVQIGLQRAQQAYLEQRFADMIGALNELEQRHLAVLAQPQHASVLWEVAFQLGLAYHSRGQPDDAARAREQFLLALALAPERRPLRELYGPKATVAFADVLRAHASMTPRPVRVAVTPADARVVVDGLPLVPDPGGQRTRSLRPGLHVVYAQAPGFASAALLTDVAAASEITLTLTARAEPDPVDRVGPSWWAGTLHPGTPSGARAIRAVATAAGATLIVFIDVDQSSNAITAQLLAAGQHWEPVRRPTAVAAVRAALATRDGSGDLLASKADSATTRPALWERWWFWTGIGVIGSSILVATVVSANDDPRRIQIFAPTP